MGARGDAAQLVGELADGVGRDQAHIAHADVAEVEAIEFEAGHGCVDAFEGRKRHVGLADAPVGRQQAACELVPGEAFRIAFAQVRQHAGDVVLEHRVRRDEEDLARIEAAAVLVEKVGDALQQHRRLAAARDAAHQQHGHVLVTHHLVLLLLDGGRDGLHLRRAALRERCEQERVLDGHGGVEVGVQAVFLDVELAAKLEVHVDGAPIGRVGRGAVVLVVVHLGHGRAPVHDKAAVRLVRDARRADIELLGLLPGLELQGDFREVRLLEQQLDSLKLLGVCILRQVVRVDHAVHGREVRVGLHGVGVRGEVGRQLLRHRPLVLGRRLACLFHPAHEGAPSSCSFAYVTARCCCSCWKTGSFVSAGSASWFGWGLSVCKRSPCARCLVCCPAATGQSCIVADSPAKSKRYAHAPFFRQTGCCRRVAIIASEKPSTVD